MTEKKLRDDILRQFRLDWDQFSTQQKQMWLRFIKIMENEIPKTDKQLRQEISDKTKLINRL